MHYLSLCAGVGGGDLGLRLVWPGARCVGYCEREAFAQAVLLARMEDEALERAPVWTDLARFDGRPFRGRVDLILAADPCQEHSVAGKREGEGAERDLWPHVARIIDECRPALVVRENVPGGMRHIHGTVLTDLRAMGYRAAAGLFSASEVGAPHRRERVFVLAVTDTPGRSKDGEGPAARGRGESPCDRADLGLADGARRETSGPRHRLDASSEPLAGGGGVAYADERGRGYERFGRIRKGQQVNGTTEERGYDARRRDLPLWPPGRHDLDGWSRVPTEAQPALLGVADGVARSVERSRIAAVGNGIVPLVLAHAVRTLANRLT